MIRRSVPSDRRTPLVYIALGDSTVYGRGATSPNSHYVARLFACLQQEYPAARLTNLGTPMATAADVLATQVADAILHQPNLVTLSVGPNDLRQGRAPNDFARRVDVILERLDRETTAVVLLNALPDLARAPRFREPERSMMTALIRHYNHALQHVADGFGIDLVELDISDRPDNEQRSFFSEDGYHPSDAGYAAWAASMWQALRQKILEPAHLLTQPA